MNETLAPLNDLDKQTLKAFLAHQDRPDGTLNYTQFIGFLYGVLCAPKFLSTEDWLPFVFNGESANAEKQTEMQKILMNMVQHYKAAFDDLLSGQCNPPLNISWADSAIERMELEHFCQGFVTAFSSIEDVWKETITRFEGLEAAMRGDVNLEHQIYSIMGLISTLAAPDLNIERSQDPSLLQENLPIFAQQLPDAIYAMAQIGGKLDELFQTLDEAKQATPS